MGENKIKFSFYLINGCTGARYILLDIDMVNTNFSKGRKSAYNNAHLVGVRKASWNQ